MKKSVAKYLAEIGRKGGLKTGPTKARDPAKMRAAARKRWAQHVQAEVAPEKQEASSGGSGSVNEFESALRRQGI